MKELQKYYAENVLSTAVDVYGPFYLASEADAAFAEMRREHAEEVEIVKAEAVKANNDQYTSQLLNELNTLRKQAERYEKLRRLSPAGFAIIYLSWNDAADQLDALVDQLPASGEASAY